MDNSNDITLAVSLMQNELNLRPALIEVIRRQRHQTWLKYLERAQDLLKMQGMERSAA